MKALRRFLYSLLRFCSRKVFLSYSGLDKPQADRAMDTLHARGFRVWRDREDIPVSAVWEDTIGRAICRAPTIVVLFSPNSVANPWVIKETNWAAAKGKGHRLLGVKPASLTLPHELWPSTIQCVGKLEDGIGFLRRWQLLELARAAALVLLVGGVAIATAVYFNLEARKLSGTIQIGSDERPVRVYIDGQYEATLDDELTSRTFDLRQGKHRIEARRVDMRAEQWIRVEAGGETQIFWFRKNEFGGK